MVTAANTKRPKTKGRNSNFSNREIKVTDTTRICEAAALCSEAVRQITRARQHANMQMIM